MIWNSSVWPCADIHDNMILAANPNNPNNNVWTTYVVDECMLKPTTQPERTALQHEKTDLSLFQFFR